MAKLRSISTEIWSDPYFEDLNSSEKLLFIYLITNEKTNMLGIYENTVRKMSFETGINKSTVEQIIKKFQTDQKIKYINNYVVLVNFLKHQNYNTNMKKSAIDVYNNLPKELKNKDLDISKVNPLEGFETLLNHFGMVRKVEVELEYESELESKSETEEILETVDVFDFEVFWDLYDKKVGDKEKIKKKYDNLPDDIKQKIFEHVELYIKAQPDKKFRKNPETYINQKSWNDEIIYRHEQTGITKNNGESIEDYHARIRNSLES